MSAEVLLDVRDLTRRFGGLTAVNKVSFQVQQQQIKGLIGPNGAGKTTLFNLVSGVLPPTSGEILLAGRPIQGRPPHQVAWAGIARTFQNIELFANMTVLENVMVGRHVQTRHGMLAAALRLPPVAR
ncbi:MAG TPA: hypothetical protein DEP84_10150, partial [Chloroflexi bacterium]|nr:hypothetical protein [Chloroflexota bacterium]